MTAHLKTPLSSSWSLWVIRSHWPHQGRRRLCLQTGVWAAGCLVQSQQLGAQHTQNCGDDSGLQEDPPCSPPTHHHEQHCGCSGVIQVPGHHYLSGPEVGHSHWLCCKKGAAEAVFSPTDKEVQLATGAAETVLLCHHWVCPVFIYNCLVWLSYQNRHQKTTTDSHDCWEDYRCPSNQPPRFFISRVTKRAEKVTLDPSHPVHSLFELLPSGWCKPKTVVFPPGHIPPENT